MKLILIVFFVMITNIGYSAPPSRMGVATTKYGEITIVRNDTNRHMYKTSIPSGSYIQVTDQIFSHDVRVTVEFRDGSKIRLEPNSHIMLANQWYDQGYLVKSIYLYDGVLIGIDVRNIVLRNGRGTRVDIGDN